MKITVDQGQSIWDLATQHCGDASAAWEIAKLNGLSVSDIPLPGSIMDVPDPVNLQMANYFKNTLRVIATAGTIPRQPQGIGVSQIGVDFTIG